MKKIFIVVALAFVACATYKKQKEIQKSVVTTNENTVILAKNQQTIISAIAQFYGRTVKEFDCKINFQGYKKTYKNLTKSECDMVKFILVDIENKGGKKNMAKNQ